jgi:hypothetical protein
MKKLILAIFLMASVAQARPMWGLWQSSSAPLWTPSNLTTYAWYDASDTNTITESAGAVSQWDDKSGNNKHATQGTGTYQPTTGSRTIDGLNVLDFDGANNQLDLTSVISLSGEFGFFAVFENDIVGEANMYFGETSGDNKIGFYSSKTFLRVLTSDDRTLAFGLGNNPVIVGVTRNSANKVDMAYNAAISYTRMFSDVAQSGASTWNRIGDGNGTAQGWNGTLGEIIVISGTVSLSDRQKLEGYLAWKWGLEDNLPADHPYKDSAPTQ